ncbi:MAG: hypothetical protein ACRCW1_08410, partial [Anaerotignaceae bacterium]
ITTLGYNEAINTVILEKSFDIKNVFVGENKEKASLLKVFKKIPETEVCLLSAGQSAKINENTTIDCVYPYFEESLSPYGGTQTLGINILTENNNVVFLGDTDVSDQRFIASNNKFKDGIIIVENNSGVFANGSLGFYNTVKNIKTNGKQFIMEMRQ